MASEKKGAWGSAKEVPGTAALNAGGYAVVISVSCASAGNCTAGGSYTDGSGHVQAFVVSQKKGTWGSAVEVPGTAALNADGNAQVNTVSCVAAGDCAAGGYYRDASGHYQAFVAAQGNGTWGSAEELPGIGALNPGGLATILALSCRAAGRCTAGGYYLDGSAEDQGFVADEVNGAWGTAQQVPGLAALNHGGSQVSSLSCGQAGACSAVGYYTDGAGHRQAFAAGEAGGVWGTAQQIPGTAALGVAATAGAVSCASAGNCTAGGSYTDTSGHGQPFVVTETGGTWNTAQEIPGIAALNTGGDAQLLALSCGSPGNCGVVGLYYASANYYAAFAVSEVSGTWGSAVQIPGLGPGSDAQTISVSCPRTGYCGAGGTYGTTQRLGFVVSNNGGAWGTALQVPGTAPLNTGGFSSINSVSCASAGNCYAGGQYEDTSGRAQAFAVTELGGTWNSAAEVPGIATLNTGGDSTADTVSCPSGYSCTAAGSYVDSSGNDQVWATGTADNAEEIPGTGGLNAGGYATATSLSCPSPGSCAVGGQYTDSNGDTQAFVDEMNTDWGTAEQLPGTASVEGGAVESVSCPVAPLNCVAGGFAFGETETFVAATSGPDGPWGNAQEVPGLAALNASAGIVTSLSCASAGNCSAGGQYTSGPGVQAFVVTESGGTWGNAQEVPGTAALNTGGGAEVTSISCPSAGNCTAVGWYTDTPGHQQVFVTDQVGGIWSNAQEAPGTAALNTGGKADITSVSCAAAGYCSAGGSYTDSTGHSQAFVTEEIDGLWNTAQEVPGTAALNAGGSAQISSVSCAAPGNCSAGGYYTDSSGQTKAFVEDETAAS